MNQTIARRLTRLGYLSILIFLVVGVGLCYREASWQEKTHGHEDREEWLRLAVSAIRRAPTREWVPEYRNAKGMEVLCGTDDTCRYDWRSNLRLLDCKFREIKASGRLNGRYYLDLDTLVNEFEEERLPLSSVKWAVRRLANDRLLSVVEWRDVGALRYSVTKAGSTGQVADLPVGSMRERNPWGAIPGRMLVQERGARNDKPVLLSVAGTAEEWSDGRSKLPSVYARHPSCRFSAMAELEYLLLPYMSFDVAKSNVDRKNRLRVGRNAIPIGYDVVLTVDPQMQALAATVTKENANNPLVDQAAIAVMDIDDGEILSLSLDGEKKKGMNPLFLEFPPASTVKVVLAAGLLMESERLTREMKPPLPLLRSLPRALKVSDTAWFQRAALDFEQASIFKKSANRFGWNSGEGGGMMDLLFGGRPSGNSKAGPLIGRVIVDHQKHNVFKTISDNNLEGLPSLETLDKAIRDNKRPSGVSRDTYEAAKLLRIQVAGQGDARTSLFGELLVIAHVARAANGKVDVPMPHVVRRLLTASGAPLVSAPQTESMPAALSPQSGKALAGYLTQVNHKGGTAGESFRKVFGRYVESGDMIFGKTGTTDLVRSVPYQIFVAAFSRQKGGERYDTAIISVVKLQRDTGVNVKKAFDRENRAAEMGLQLLRNIRNIR